MFQQLIQKAIKLNYNNKERKTKPRRKVETTATSREATIHINIWITKKMDRQRNKDSERCQGMTDGVP